MDSRCNVKPELRITKVGIKGQIVIPNQLRAALKLEVGDAMIVQLEGTRIVLERRRTVILSLVGKYAQPVPKPTPVSIAKSTEGREQDGA
jgi:AbrB family looped-hinge helix DNA binding protein